MDDYLYWQEADKRIVKRSMNFIKDTRRTPFEVGETRTPET